MNAAEARIEFVIKVLNSDQKEFMDEMFAIYEEEKKKEINKKIVAANKRRNKRNDI